MHEYSIIQALIGRVTEAAEQRQATRIHRITVRIGELAGVDADLLSSAFELVRGHSLCAEAELTINRVAARWDCAACGRVIEAAMPLCCPTCDEPARLSAGDEMYLDRIEMEVPDV